MTENWYLILELEYDPDPVTDEEVISRKIEEKSKFWVKNFNHPMKGAQYRRYNQLLGQIKKDMLGPENIREELIRDACERTYGPIDKILKNLHKSELPPETLQKIADRQKVDVKVVETRAAALGIRVGAPRQTDDNSLYDTYYKKKPANADKYSGLASQLSALHYATLYDFLCDGTSVKSPRNLPCEVLTARAEERRTKDFYKNDSTSGIGVRLCAQCKECFHDEASKRSYDQYLEYQQRREILDNLKSTYDYVGELGQEVWSDALRQLTGLLKNQETANDLMCAFCRVEKMPIPPSASSGMSATAHIRICRCGCVNDLSDGRQLCQACGLPFQITCPNCGKVNDSSIRVCRCGFRFENIDRAVSLFDLAETAIDAMDFDMAGKTIADALRYWPNAERGKELKRNLTERRKLVGPALKQLRSACREKRYYEARRLLEEIRKVVPSYQEPAIEEELQSGIRLAEEFKKKALAARDEAGRLEYCERALSCSRDCPGIGELVASYPPAPPTSLSIKTNPSAGCNLLSWKTSPSQGTINYLVVRKEAAVPENAQDGTLVAKVGTAYLTDRTIKPGIPYFYAVFAERSGVPSPALASREAVVNLPEVRSLMILAGDGMLRLSWERPADNASVHIIRIDPTGRQKKLPDVGREEYLDQGLENHLLYEYRVFLSYTVGVQTIKTPGITVSGTPQRPPLPVSKMSVKPRGDEEFTVTWENPEEGRLQLYCSEKKPEYVFGDLVPLKELKNRMRPLPMNKTSETSAIFRHTGEEPLYLLAVSVSSDSAVTGATARVLKGGSMGITGVMSVNGGILMTLKWPDKATGCVVLYRHDRFPDDLSDREAVRKHCTLTQYQYDGGLRIDECKPVNYYFTVFAEFRLDGEQDYSMGTNHLFANAAKQELLYSIEVKKKLFKGSELLLTFESGGRRFLLPDIDVMSAQDRAPMYKKSGKLFYQIPAQEASGSLRVSIPVPAGLERDTYIKPFLRDESLSGSIILKLKLGSENKIS